MISVTKIFILVGIVEVLSVIIKDPPPTNPPVHVLLQGSKKPANKNFEVISFKLYIPQRQRNSRILPKGKKVSYNKNYNSSGLPKSLKQIFDFYRQEGNYYPNNKQVSKISLTTEKTIPISEDLPPVQYHNEVHHSNKYDSFSDGTDVRPVANFKDGKYSSNNDDDEIHFPSSTSENGEDADINYDDINENRKESYKFYQ